MKTGFGRLLGGWFKTRKIVLFAWELGGGLGHIQRLLPIATELAARDHRVVFALQRTENAETITRVLPGAKVLHVPERFNLGARAKGTAHNYADVLHRCG